MFHSYFIVHAFDLYFYNIYSQHCALHRRKFRTNVSVHICINFKLVILPIVLKLSHRIFSDLKLPAHPYPLRFHIHTCKCDPITSNPF